MTDVRRKVLIIPLALSMASAWVTKVYAMGWLTLLLAVPYALVTVIHAAVHLVSLRRCGPVTRRQLLLVLASHLFLVGAFLLQWDAGDGLGWLTITAILGEGPGYPSSAPPLWWPHNAATFNMIVFVPVALTWVFLGFRRHAGESKKR